MKRWSAGRMLALYGLSAVGWALVALGCLMVGSTGSIGWPDRAVLGFRLEPVLLASLVGAALAAAGVTYQALLANPLADPYLLGTSSGAMLASYLGTLPALTTISITGLLGQQAMAFLGGLLAVTTVLAIAGHRGRLEPVTLILVGVIVNSFCSAVFLLVNAVVKDPATPGGPLLFLVGGLQTNLQRWQMIASAVVAAAAWGMTAYLAGVLNVGSMEDAEAESLGVPINRLRWIGVGTASLMTAAAVAVSGPIGFVGLICPHLGRLFVGPDVRRLLPVATALGAILLCSADAAARKLASVGPVGTYLPVGVITSMLGGPFFLMLLLTRKPRA
ncbi:MAG: iron ABC transporter permease [Phycisphaerales bacterium]|nr:iron ABC transporter permease [Phycisphaerales bacterium]